MTPLPRTAPTSQKSCSQLEERHERAGTELTDDIVERAREAGLDAHGDVLNGEPVDQITEYASVYGIDLTVLGVRGRSAVGEFLLGSVRRSRVIFEPIRSPPYF